MMKTKALPLSFVHKISTKALFFIVLAVLLVTFFSYVYLVNKTIMNVVAREKVESNISSLSTTIGTLEYKYITLKNSVTLDLAYSKGFKEATPSQFIARQKSGNSLSYNFSR